MHRSSTGIAVLALAMSAGGAAAQVKLESAPLDASLTVRWSPPVAAPPVTPPTDPRRRPQVTFDDTTAFLGLNTLGYSKALEELRSSQRFEVSSTASSATGSSGTAPRIPLTAGWVESIVLPEVAGFIGRRAKAEALASASDQLRTGLCPATVAAGVIQPGKLLVATCALTLQSNPYEVPVAWTTYKAAFEQDLANLPLRFLQELPATEPRAQIVRTISLTGIDMVRRMERGQDPVVIFGNLAHLADSNCPAGNAAPEYCLSLRAVGFGIHQLQDLLNKGGTDDRVLQAALQDSIYMENLAKALATKFGSLPDDPTRIRRFRTGFGRLATRVATLQKVGQQLRQNENRAEAFNLYADAALQILQLLPDLRPVVGTQEAATQMDSALVYLNETARILEQGRARQYTNVFVGMSALAARLQMDGVYVKGVPDWYLRYGPFVAEVASAQTAEAFSAALDAAVAPMGSYRRKRANGFSLGVNAYLGFQGGRERLRDLPKEIGDTTAGHFGLAMPIGIEAVLGLGKTSVGVFVSALDLGNLANFRTEEENPNGEAEVSTEPEISLSSVVSPGIYAVFGLSNRLPITLGVGASWPLGVRSVRDDEGADAEASALRFGIFAGVDVPLFRF